MQQGKWTRYLSRSAGIRNPKKVSVSVHLSVYINCGIPLPFRINLQSSCSGIYSLQLLSPMSGFEIHHILRDIGPGFNNATSTTASLHHLYALVSGVSITSLLPAVAVLYICGVASLALYRLYFHPISQFPGPRIAAVTGWYQAYYDIWKGGKMTQNIALLHEKYGGPRMRRACAWIYIADFCNRTNRPDWAQQGEYCLSVFWP